MNNIKKFRVAFGYTQKELVKHLGTTQQTWKSWEKGASELQQSILKDMALIFSTSVYDLLGNNPLTSRVTTNRYYLFSKNNDVDGFWGHLGIMFKGQSKHHWFPITEQSSNDLYELLTESLKSSVHQPFVSIHTLNNRALWVNLKKIKSIVILDDNADAPIGDWDLTWDGYYGESIEIYRALEDSLYDNLDNYSESFKKFLQNIIEKYNLDDDGIMETVCHTHVYSVNGVKESINVDAKHLWDIEWHINGEFKFESHFLNLSSSEISRFRNMSQIAMISAPLHWIMDEALKDLE